MPSLMVLQPPRPALTWAPAAVLREAAVTAGALVTSGVLLVACALAAHAQASAYDALGISPVDVDPDEL